MIPVAGGGGSLLGIWAAACIAVLLSGDEAECAASCGLDTTVSGRRYVFNLAAPVGDYPHGARSEDGFYAVKHPGPEGDQFWFQLCEHMKFNSAPPNCQLCSRTCGGMGHCGETCSALQATFSSGYGRCRTVGMLNATSFNILDVSQPGLGVALNMSMGDSDDCPHGMGRSLMVRVVCATDGKAEVPTQLWKQPNETCAFVTEFRHPAGCPIMVEARGTHIGWLGTLFIVLVCAFSVYMVVGIAYRAMVLGVAGLEAIPNLEVWRDAPQRMQGGISWLIDTLQSWVESRPRHHYQTLT